jgi:hypothetical protein
VETFEPHDRDDPAGFLLIAGEPGIPFGFEALPRINGQLDRNAIDQTYGGGRYRASAENLCQPGRFCCRGDQLALLFPVWGRDMTTTRQLSWNPL